MKCPKCGYRRQSRDNAFVPPTECPSCGVVYSKHEDKSDSGPTRSQAQNPPSLRPSPVDTESLKKAQERVEQRLRKRLQGHEQDDRHARTLELAKRFTDEGMRKRQQKLDRGQTEAVEEPTPGIQEATDAENVVEDNADTSVAREPEQAAEAHESSEAAMTEPSQNETIATAAEESAGGTNSEITEPLEASGETSEEAAAGVTAETAAPAETPEIAKEDETVDARDAVAETTVPGEAPDDDVSVETVILRSSVSVADENKATAALDATPVEEDDAADEEAPLARESDAVSAKAESEPMPEVPEAVVAAQAATYRRTPDVGTGHLRMLSAVAWLILGAGIIGAILSWTTISDVEAGMRIPVPDSVNTLSLGLLLGFAYLATGVLGFAFFWVSSIISRQLKDIRRMLMLQPGGLADAEPEEVAVNGSPATEKETSTGH